MEDADEMLHLVLKEPRQIQVCIRIRAYRQPDEMSMGREGIQGILWRRE
jgi:hypothetical protein